MGWNRAGWVQSCFSAYSHCLSDVLHSEVVQEAAKPEAVVQFEPPVIRLELKRARKELPDEDIRRLALCKLRSLILQDPLASQLGRAYTPC